MLYTLKKQAEQRVPMWEKQIQSDIASEVSPFDKKDGDYLQLLTVEFIKRHKERLIKTLPTSLHFSVHDITETHITELNKRLITFFESLDDNGRHNSKNTIAILVDYFSLELLEHKNVLSFIASINFEEYKLR